MHPNVEEEAWDLLSTQASVPLKTLMNVMPRHNAGAVTGDLVELGRAYVASASLVLEREHIARASVVDRWTKIEMGGTGSMTGNMELGVGPK